MTSKYDHSGLINGPMLTTWNRYAENMFVEWQDQLLAAKVPRTDWEWLVERGFGAGEPFMDWVDGDR